MRVGHRESQNQTHGSLRQCRNLWQLQLLLALAAVAILGVISGCAGVVSAGGPKTPPPQVSVQVTPTSLNFGNVSVGKKVSSNVSVANTGNVAINIAQANVSGKQFSVSGLTMPLSLPVGQSVGFQVWFDATSAGGATGTLTVQTDTGVFSGQVALIGNATTAPQQISVTPASLNLGSATVGTTANGTVTISNLGGSNLTISLLSVRGCAFVVVLM